MKSLDHHCQVESPGCPPTADGDMAAGAGSEASLVSGDPVTSSADSKPSSEAAKSAPPAPVHRGQTEEGNLGSDVPEPPQPPQGVPVPPPPVRMKDDSDLFARKVDDFITDWNINRYAAQKLRRQPVEIQRRILSSDFDRARNVSAMVVSL